MDVQCASGREGEQEDAVKKRKDVGHSSASKTGKPVIQRIRFK